MPITTKSNSREYEDESVQKKYMEDIESICNDQLEGQSIYNDSMEMANKIYQEYRSQSKH